MKNLLIIIMLSVIYTLGGCKKEVVEPVDSNEIHIECTVENTSSVPEHLLRFATVVEDEDGYHFHDHLFYPFSGNTYFWDTTFVWDRTATVHFAWNVRNVDTLPLFDSLSVSHSEIYVNDILMGSASNGTYGDGELLVNF